MTPDLGKLFRYLAERKDWRPVVDGKVVKSKPFNFDDPVGRAYDFCDCPNPRLVAQLAVELIEKVALFKCCTGCMNHDRCTKIALREYRVQFSHYQRVKERLEGDKP